MFAILLILSYCITAVDGQGQSGDIRLASGNNNTHMGRVEVFNNNQWGTVCDVGFDRAAARVACMQMDNRDGTVVGNVPGNGIGFGPGTGPIWMVQCSGSETRLINCNLSPATSTACTHDRDVGVNCFQVSASTASPGQTTRQTTSGSIVIGAGYGNCSSPQVVRLIGPSNQPYLGVIQINVPGTGWMTVCDNNWNRLNAQVACRMLCYSTQAVLAGGADFSVANILEPVMQDWYTCQGSEHHLSNCPINAGGCAAHEKAKVDCNPQLDFKPQQSPLNLTLDCSSGLISGTFIQLGLTSGLECGDFQLAHIHAGPCTWRCYNGANPQTVIISMPLDECGTDRTGNATHLLYNNSLLYEPSSANPGEITRESIYRIDLMCALPRAYTPSRPWEVVTKNISDVAPGLFNITLAYYTDKTFQVERPQIPLQVALGEGLYAALTLHIIDRNTKLIVTDCFATPTPSYHDLRRHYLFQDKCIQDVTTSLYPLTNFMFGLHFELFRFVQHSLVYLHCSCIVCGVDERHDECDQSCRTLGRRKRSLDHATIMVDGPVIQVYKRDEDTEHDTGDNSDSGLEFDKDDPRNPANSESDRESVQIQTPPNAGSILLPGYLLLLVTVLMYVW